MNNVIKILQDQISGIDLDNFHGRMNKIFDNLLKNDIPTMDFIKKEELDDYRIISRQNSKKISINGMDAELYTISVEILTFKIIVYHVGPLDKDYVEIYFEDDLVFKANGEYKWQSFKELGIDDGVSIWKFDLPEFFIEGEWQRYFIVIHLCQEEEYAKMEREIEKKDMMKAEPIKHKSYSDLKIEEKNT